MSLKNIKLNNQSERGFTIVELLIVVVVIAILAAITIVSYNGITNRANQSSAKSAATTVQKKIELYQGEVGNYPITQAALSGDQSKSYYVASTTFGSADPVTTSGSAQQGTKYVRVQACISTGSTVTASTITGIRIGYYNYG